MEVKETTNESRGLVGGDGRGQMEVEETTNESQDSLVVVDGR
jgi:hypothetical protein